MQWNPNWKAILLVFCEINAVLHHKKFRQLSLRYLNQDYFINGNMWAKDKILRRNITNVYVLHASWTTNHLDKIHKWNKEKQWYLTPKCSLWNGTLYDKEICDEISNELNINCTTPVES